MFRTFSIICNRESIAIVRQIGFQFSLEIYPEPKKVVFRNVYVTCFGSTF